MGRVPSVPTAGGYHLLADFWVKDADPLRHVDTWEHVLPEACRAAGATVLGAQFHQFQPEGVTGIVLLSESHASVHTWPEAGLVTLDVFTCGALDAAAIVDAIRQRVSPVRERVTAVARGDAQPAARSSRTATGTPGEPLPDHRRGEGGIRADAAPAGASGPAAGTEPAPASYTLYPDPD